MHDQSEDEKRPGPATVIEFCPHPGLEETDRNVLHRRDEGVREWPLMGCRAAALRRQIDGRSGPALPVSLLRLAVVSAVSDPEKIAEQIRRKRIAIAVSRRNGIDVA
jgi:hypothetical protein